MKTIWLTTVISIRADTATSMLMCPRPFLDRHTNHRATPIIRPVAATSPIRAMNPPMNFPNCVLYRGVRAHIFSPRHIGPCGYILSLLCSLQIHSPLVFWPSANPRCLLLVHPCLNPLKKCQLGSYILIPFSHSYICLIALAHVRCMQHLWY